MRVTELLIKLYLRFGDKEFRAEETKDILGDDYISLLDIYLSTNMIIQTNDSYKLSDQAIDLAKY